MKRTGRPSILAIIGLICLIIIVPVLFMSGRSPETAAQDFMIALSEGNAEKLAKLSVLGNIDEAERRKLWEETLKRGEHYRFAWRITNSSKISEDKYAIELQIKRNLQLKMGESENKFSLPVRKVDGDWKVDVHSMDRDIYPGLPRG